MCQDHICVCREVGRGEGVVGEGGEREILAATHRAIQQVRVCERERG